MAIQILSIIKAGLKPRVVLLDVESVDNYVISGIVAHNNKPQDPREPQL
jgi:hypothetical protein